LKYEHKKGFSETFSKYKPRRAQCFLVVRERATMSEKKVVHEKKAR
jgi:hypothetical protein